MAGLGGWLKVCSKLNEKGWIAVCHPAFFAEIINNNQDNRTLSPPLFLSVLVHLLQLFTSEEDTALNGAQG